MTAWSVEALFVGFVILAALLARPLGWLIAKLDRAAARRAPIPFRVVPGRFLAYPQRENGYPAVAPWKAWRFGAPNLDAAVERVRRLRLPPGVLQITIRVEAQVRRPWYGYLPWWRPWTPAPSVLLRLESRRRRGWIDGARGADRANEPRAGNVDFGGE